MDDPARDAPVELDAPPVDRLHEGGPTPPAEADAAAAVRGLFASQPMRFPNAYAWLMLFSAMDIMLTWVILSRGGREVNGLANWVIQSFGLNGMIIYKFALVLFFVVLCEMVGKLRHSSGMMLSRAGVAIGVFPVVWSLGLLFRHTA